MILGKALQVARETVEHMPETRFGSECHNAQFGFCKEC